MFVHDGLPLHKGDRLRISDSLFEVELVTALTEARQFPYGAIINYLVDCRPIELSHGYLNELYSWDFQTKKVMA